MIEYYNSALGPDLAMFSKMSVKPTLSETYEEVERVEAKMESIENYPVQSKEKTFGKKPLLLTKPKDERSQDFEGMVKMMQKLSNRVIYLKKKRKLINHISLIIKGGRTTINLNHLHTILHQ